MLIFRNIIMVWRDERKVIVKYRRIQDYYILFIFIFFSNVVVNVIFLRFGDLLLYNIRGTTKDEPILIIIFFQ